ncbi:2944_t:CDS:1, partial [Ambispora gerdemannii]
KEICINTWNISLANSESDISIPVVVEEVKKKKSKLESVRIFDQHLVSKNSIKKIDEISEAKETISPEITRETEDSLELFKRTQKNAKKSRAVVHADIFKLSTLNSKV